MRYSGISNKGNVRAINEDSSYIPTRKEHSLPNCMAVADGMGGHNAGEVASSMAIKSIVSTLKKRIYDCDSPDRAASLLTDAFVEANEKIWMLARDSQEFSGMGTTLTAGLCFNDRVVIGHIGDTRAYMVNELGLEQISEDHTLVQEMVDSGMIKREEAVHHMQRHIITRALGVREAEQADIYTREWNKGNLLLLCSDGLTEHVLPDEIVEVCWERDDLDAVCQELVKLALERGGTDNITICLALHTGVEGAE